MLGVLALFPVALLAAISIVIASRQVTRVVDKEVQATAVESSVVVGQQMTSLVALVHSFATRSSLVAAIGSDANRSSLVDSSLAELVRAAPGISASFVASLAGTSLNTYPVYPAAIGTNFAYREWYKGLVATDRPYISGAIKTHEANHVLAVTVTDYIRGSNGRPVGILGVNYSLNSIRSYAANVGRAQGITLTVSDQRGTSLTADGNHGLVSLARDPRVRAALAGRSGLLSYAPVLPDRGRGQKELSAYAPVNGTGWTVVASIPEAVAFSGLVRLRETVLVSAAALVLILLTGVWIMARADSRRRELELRLQELADHDPMTNLLNRRRFHEMFEHEVASARRHATCLALILIDIDGLKPVNDSHGHHAGDNLIVGVANTIKNHFRATDAVARLGGDEFAVLLDHVDPDHIDTVTTGLLVAIRESVWKVGDKPLVATISIGVAVTDGVTTPDITSLAYAADQALYRSKANGGDSHTVAPKDVTLNTPINSRLRDTTPLIDSSQLAPG